MKNRVIRSIVLSFALVAGGAGIAEAGQTQTGVRMADGTVFAGKLPSKKPFYAAPRDAPETMDYEHAVKFCEDFNINGKKDFHLPQRQELNILYKNKDTGALKGTFDTTGADPASWYWSLTSGYSLGAWSQRFSDGYRLNSVTFVAASVRCVRYGRG